MAPISAQAVIIVVAVLPFGFRLYPLGALGALAALVLLAGFGVGMGALSYALAITSGKQERIFAVQQTLLFPLLILSSTMLPPESGPSWMPLLFRINRPIHVVEAERAPFAGDFSHPSLPIGALATLAAAVVGLAVGTRAVRRPADRSLRDALHRETPEDRRTILPRTRVNALLGPAPTCPGRVTRHTRGSSERAARG